MTAALLTTHEDSTAVLVTEMGDATHATPLAARHPAEVAQDDDDVGGGQQAALRRHSYLFF